MADPMLHATGMQATVPMSPNDKNLSTEFQVGLLTIPQELRDKIYDHVLFNQDHILELCRRYIIFGKNLLATKGVLKDYAALSATCRQLHYEAYAPLFKQNIWGIWISKFQDYATPLRPALAHMRHIGLYCWILVDLEDGGLGSDVCVLDLNIQGKNVEFDVRMAKRSSDPEYIKRAFFEETKEESAESSRARERVEDKVEHVVKVFQAALASEGELNLAMLQDLSTSFQFITR